MAINFVPKTWKNGTTGKTPIVAEDLNRMEKGINECVKQVNINTKFMEDSLLTIEARNNLINDKRVLELNEVIDRIQNGFIDLQVGNHIPVKLATNAMFDSDEWVDADLVITGFNLRRGSGFINNQPSRPHVYMFEPHVNLMLAYPAQYQKMMPLINGDSAGGYFPIPTDTQEIVDRCNGSLLNSWLYYYIFGMKYFSDNSQSLNPDVFSDNGAHMMKLANSALTVNYTDYILDVPDWLVQPGRYFKSDALSKVPGKNGSYVAYSAATSASTSYVLDVGNYKEFIRSKFHLFSEEEIFGTNIFSSGIDTGNSRGQLPLTRLKPGYRLFGGGRYYLKNFAFYESDSAKGPGNHQCVVSSLGMADADWTYTSNAVRFGLCLGGDSAYNSTYASDLVAPSPKDYMDRLKEDY